MEYKFYSDIYNKDMNIKDIKTKFDAIEVPQIGLFEFGYNEMEDVAKLINDLDYPIELIYEEDKFGQRRTLKAKSEYGTFPTLWLSESERHNFNSIDLKKILMYSEYAKVLKEAFPNEKTNFTLSSDNDATFSIAHNDVSRTTMSVSDKFDTELYADFLVRVAEDKEMAPDKLKEYKERIEREKAEAKEASHIRGPT